MGGRPASYIDGYFCYIILDDEGVPLYVGAGRGDRLYSSRYKLGFWGGSVTVMRTKSKEKAFQLETEYIALFGRKDLRKGTLLNRTNGRGSAGRIVTEELSKKWSLARLGVKPSKATTIKMSNSNKQHYRDHPDRLEDRRKDAIRRWKDSSLREATSRYWTPEKRKEQSERAKQQRRSRSGTF